MEGSVDCLANTPERTYSRSAPQLEHLLHSGSHLQTKARHPLSPLKFLGDYAGKPSQVGHDETETSRRPRRPSTNMHTLYSRINAVSCALSRVASSIAEKERRALATSVLIAVLTAVALSSFVIPSNLDMTNQKADVHKLDVFVLVQNQLLTEPPSLTTVCLSGCWAD